MSKLPQYTGKWFPARAFLLMTALTWVGHAQTTTTTTNIYLQHNLVANTAGVADVTDPHLLNPWGVSESSTGSPFWVSNEQGGTSTLYNGSGAIIPLVVTIPPGAATTTGTGSPTGQVFNSSSGFLLANGKKASFIFATVDGTISAWNGGAAAVIEVDNSAVPAAYTGLSLGSDTNGPLLYAADFHGAKVDVFNGSFQPATISGNFVDPNLPAGYAPFNVWVWGANVYVAYAKQDANKEFDVPAVGNGLVDTFDADGNFQKQLISGGALDSPWGMAIAPAKWGAFGGALLVGNFGNGWINAFDATSGAMLGSLQDASGNPIAIPGLWDILFGNGGSGGDTNTLYFVAGIPDGGPFTPVGLFGSLAPPAAINTITNGASYLPDGGVSPGEVVLLMGQSIGPSPLAAGTIPTSGTIPTNAKVTVTFNGTPAPVLYASASFTSVIVPYEVAGSSTANVVVTTGGQTTPAFSIPIVPSAPGIFTLNESGSGVAVAFNQDGSLNSTTDAASSGTAVLLFATGEGQTDPAGEDGLVSGNLFRIPVLPVTLTIGGQTATVLYAGSLPGYVSGVIGIEAIVPAGAGTGAQPVVATIGTVTSQATATLFLQ
jgi:uncharacterized protein (TIGR03118 family)